MYIDLKKSLDCIQNCLPQKGVFIPKQLYRMYDLTLRLRSQLLAVIYDYEEYGAIEERKKQKIADIQSNGKNTGTVVTLIFDEPLPMLKEMTVAVEEHWVNMIHTAIKKAAAHPIPYFEKAFVWIEIVTPKGTNNTKVWDTSNRAINVIINNLKGIFFEDDNMEHMAFCVTGRWGEAGKTTVQISDFEASNFALSPDFSDSP